MIKKQLRQKRLQLLLLKQKEMIFQKQSHQKKLLQINKLNHKNLLLSQKLKQKYQKFKLNKMPQSQENLQLPP